MGSRVVAEWSIGMGSIECVIVSSLAVASADQRFDAHLGFLPVFV
jgi:hypothetical protein